MIDDMEAILFLRRYYDSITPDDYVARLRLIAPYLSDEVISDALGRHNGGDDSSPDVELNQEE